MKKKLLSIFSLSTVLFMVAMFLMLSSGNARCMMDLNGSKKCNLHFDDQGKPLAYVCEGTATEFNKCIATGDATEEE